MCFIFSIRLCIINMDLNHALRGGMAQWVARLTRNVEVVGSSPRCFIEQETLFLSLSTGWFKERIRA